MDLSNLDPHLIKKWLIGTTPVSAPNGISVGLAIFAQLTRVPKTRTRRPQYE